MTTLTDGYGPGAEVGLPKLNDRFVSITHKIKRNALSRGIKVIYTPNGSQALQNRLQKLDADFEFASDSMSGMTH